MSTRFGTLEKICIPNAGLSPASAIHPKLFTASVAGDVFAAISDTGSDGMAAPSSGTWLSLLQIRQKKPKESFSRNQFPHTEVDSSGVANSGKTHFRCCRQMSRFMLPIVWNTRVRVPFKRTTIRDIYLLREQNKAAHSYFTRMHCKRL